MTNPNSHQQPLEIFQLWYQQAEQVGFWRKLLTWLYPPAVIHQPDAMILATANTAGKPSARVVLFKGLINNQFSFYTNYHSQKGQELHANPQASLVFHWAFPERQVRISGTVTKLSRQASEEYWNSRPRNSQLSGAASPQSSRIASYEWLVQQVQELKTKFQNQPVVCPQHWGGFAVDPQHIEFWQAKANRLHHRQIFSKQNDGTWLNHMLAP